MIKRLRKIVMLTNEEAVDYNDARRDTCILTSFALCHVLQQLGHAARPLRIRVSVHPNDQRLYGTVMGYDPEERRAAAPGMWHGHLAVVVDDRWLLDATLDQANKPDEWPPEAFVDPAVVKLSDAFWREHGYVGLRIGTTRVAFSLYRRQVGFMHAGDARPSHWRPLAERILTKLNAKEKTQ